MAKSKGSTNAKRAAYELRQQIVHGRLPGGTRLYEVALAEALQISRTPVREALFRLVEEGLLQRGDGSGFFVRSFSIGDVIDAIELRGVLEGTAARLAAERGVAGDRMDRISAILDEIDTSVIATGGGLDRYSELNAEFHNQLGALCGSAIIEGELDRVKSLPFASPSAFVLGAVEIYDARTTLALAQAQHRTIIEAISNGEGARAEFLAREHARTARNNFELYRADPDAEKIAPGLAFIAN